MRVCSSTSRQKASASSRTSGSLSERIPRRLRLSGKLINTGDLTGPLRDPGSGWRDIQLPTEVISYRIMSHRKTSVEINEELLTAVQRVLATATLKDTIEEAFREVLRAEARREEVEALSTMRGMDLANPEVMAGAWRS